MYASLVMLGGVPLFLVFRVWGQVLSPPTGGSASVNIMSGVLYPSTSSLCVTPVCDFTFADMCFVSHVVSCAYDVVH